MKDDKGKVILSLLVGATAGVVTGLLLAPETGDDTRSNLRRSATKWGGEFSKLVKETFSPGSDNSPGHTNPDAAVSEDKHAADRLLRSMSGSISTAHTHTDANTDYDGAGDSSRHRAPY